MTNAATDVPRETGGDTLASPPRDLLKGASLFLDFDGTLIEIAARPDGVAVDARLRVLIGRLGETLDGRIAIVSGRPVAAIVEYLGDGVAVSGSHGLEMRWPDGRELAPERAPGLDRALSAMRDLAAGYAGVLVEDKPYGVALHYRGAPEAEQACRELVDRLAAESALIPQIGKKVCELRMAGADKGAAIHAFMDSLPFAGSRPVFLGDDTTDEPGFAAAARVGGAGVLVGAGRATDARYRLTDVGATLDWLEETVGSAI